MSIVGTLLRTQRGGLCRILVACSGASPLDHARGVIRRSPVGPAPPCPPLSGRPYRRNGRYRYIYSTRIAKVGLPTRAPSWRDVAIAPRAILGVFGSMGFCGESLFRAVAAFQLRRRMLGGGTGAYFKCYLRRPLTATKGMLPLCAADDHYRAWRS